MPDVNGVAAGNLGGLSGSGAGGVLWWTVVLVRPVDGGRPAQAAPTLVFKITDSWDDGTAQAQVEVDNDVGFGSLTWSTTLTSVAHNTDKEVAVGVALSNGSTYYWRVRGGDGTSWGAWSAVRSFTVDLLTGNAAHYLYVNNGIDAGAGQTKHLTSHAYVHVNNGIEAGVGQTKHLTSHHYVYVNNGIEIGVNLTDLGVHYLYYGDVNTATPEPHIWYLLPTSGRQGDGFDIYGFGFGDLQATYSGVAQMDIGGWTGLSVSAWQTFPANAAAYSVNRHVGTDTAIARPETGHVDTFGGATLDPTWESTAGTWTLDGSGLLVPPAAQSKLLVPVLPEGRIDVYPTVAEPDNGGIVFRYVDETHYWVFWFKHIKLGHYDGGGYVAYSYSGSENWTAGAKYSVVWTTSQIQVLKADVVLLTVTGSFQAPLSAPNAEKQVKGGVHGAGVARFDSFTYASPLDRPNLDMQHQRISVTVPASAAPPGHPVRVQTDGA